MSESTDDVVEPLRGDEEFVVWRLRRPDGLSAGLLVVPTGERPSFASLGPLEHAYSLRDELDPTWATQPLKLSHHGGKRALLLHDPGGVFLDSLLGRPMGVAVGLRLAVGVAKALGRFHARGFIHRDVKPANLIVESAKGEAWLTGFGLAWRLPRHRASLKPPEVSAGTLAYMAPEGTGRMNRSIDARSDLYSLGVTLYEMFVGALPFSATDPLEWVHCHIAREPIPPHERFQSVPQPVSRVVMKLLAKAPEERYQTAAGLEADLRRCLAEWVAHGEIKPFRLGAHDVSDRLFTPEKLYGREAEIDLLRGAFDRVVNHGQAEIVLVSGYSGVGKSSVVNELRKALISPRGLFASGKFDQYKRNVPYATIAQAFEGLVRTLLTQSDPELAVWRRALGEALGPNGQLIVNLIPEIELITGTFPSVPEFAPQEARIRFQRVFRKFLGVFARPEHPLVLFLDDLQWVDLATLELLKHLVTEPEVRHVLLVGAYRENELTASDAFALTLQEIRRAGAPVRQIVLKPLSSADVECLVLDALHCQTQDYQPLARLIHEKTGGNPFFAIQFLTTLAQEGWLTFDGSAGAWAWDLPRIHAQGFTDNVADLMASKLDRLPEPTQETLRRLACLGNCADPLILNAVLQGSEPTRALLWEAVRTGFIVELNGAYAFAHDRVQEAAYALIPEDLRPRLHLRIGRLLVTELTPKGIDDNIFDVVNQFNLGRELLSDPKEKEVVAELNLRAGKIAKASAAYASASVYLAVGMDLIGSNAWAERYELAFGLWLQRAESEYLTGNFEEAERLIAELLNEARSTVDKMAGYRLRILLHLMRAEYREAVDCGLACLRLVGVEMPVHPTRADVQAECDTIFRKLGDRSIESLLELPPMTDPEMQAAVEVLSTIAAAAFNTDVTLMYLFFCQMVSITLEYGTAGASTHGYAELGTILGPVFHRYADGYRFGKLACGLIEKYGFNTYKTKVYFCVQRSMLWTQPIGSAIDHIRLAIDAGVETHDLVFACFSWHHLITGLLLRGVHLDEVWREAQNGLGFILKAKFRDEDGIPWSQQQFILALRGETAPSADAVQVAYDEETFESQYAARKPFAVFHQWTLRLQRHYLFGEYEAAFRSARKARALLWSADQHIQAVDYRFYRALTAAALHETGETGARPELLADVQESLRAFREWAESCPTTFLDKYTALLAVMAGIEGRETDAMRLHEDAIRAARDQGFLQHEGVANELAAKFYLRHQFETIAAAYLQRARSCFAAWGATAKVRQLDRTYPQLQSESRVLAPSAALGAGNERFDVEAVVKASQALSGEMVLPRLVERLLRIALQHAGADRAVLIGVSGGEPKVEAEAVSRRDGVAVHLHQPAATTADLPETVLRYVARSRESVILDDALVSNRFAEDKYLRRGLSRSVLCLPLVKRAQLTGVLYLENRLTPHVFTPARLTVLRLLASQAAISLENARLYADLQRENLERKHAEAESHRQKTHLDELFELAPEAIVLSDVHARVVRVNREFTKLFGYTPEEAKGEDLAELIVPEEVRDDFEKKQALITVGRGIDAETVRRRKDGEKLIVSVVAAPVSLPGGQTGAYTIYRDITGRKRADEELRRREVDLRKAQAELAHVARVTTMGELAASIAHEVNQPITGVVINANACLRWLAGVKETSPNLREARETIQRILRDGKRAGEIIGRIRALFKKAETTRALLDLNESIQEVVVLARGEMDKRGVALRFELEPNLPAVVGDRVQLQQVMLNLILNAIEAMAGIEGRARELVLGTKQVAAKEAVQVTVRDSGPGIDPASLERVFAAFHTTKPGGLGMGLPISRSIVENHGGRLWAAARGDGPGATFQFTLPAGASADVPATKR